MREPARQHRARLPRPAVAARGSGRRQHAVGEDRGAVPLALAGDRGRGDDPSVLLPRAHPDRLPGEHHPGEAAGEAADPGRVPAEQLVGEERAGRCRRSTGRAGSVRGSRRPSRSRGRRGAGCGRRRVGRAAPAAESRRTSCRRPARGRGARPSPSCPGRLPSRPRHGRRSRTGRSTARRRLGPSRCPPARSRPPSPCPRRRSRASARWPSRRSAGRVHRDRLRPVHDLGQVDARSRAGRAAAGRSRGRSGPRSRTTAAPAAPDRRACSARRRGRGCRPERPGADAEVVEEDVAGVPGEEPVGQLRADGDGRVDGHQVSSAMSSAAR